MQFAIPLPKKGGPRFRQIYSRLREAIISGNLRSGQKLPSTRDLAEQVGVSRTVVLLAYEHLLAEGFAVGRKGSGTYVSRDVSVRSTDSPRESVKLRISEFGRSAQRAWSVVQYPPRPQKPLPYDFAYGRSDLASFPFEMWRRTLLRCARRAPVAGLDYGPAGGHPALRAAIAAHVQRSRAVVCDASQVVVVNGSQQALDLIARVLITRGDCVAIEDPCYQGTREILRAGGARLLPVRLDREGLDPKRIPPKARIAFVTPSHQFPTGAILPLNRRLGLLEWAKRTEGVIVEDDYDGEFRYGQSLESLQGLDRHGRVIYIGTFSRTVFSSLRIGYLIAPKRMIEAFMAAKWLCDRHTATLEQETLAEFILSGMYERYLRRVRWKNAARRQALLESIDHHFGDRIEVTGDGAGAHIVLWPRVPLEEETIIAGAAKLGVRIYGLSGYFLRKPTRPGFMLGYARLQESEIREGIRRLGKVL